MKNDAALQNGEKYKCVQQHGEITFEQATENWECPYCLNKLAIRAEIGDYVHTIHRVLPHELTEWDLVSPEYRGIWEVINVQPDNKNNGFFRIALKEFGTKSIKAERFVPKIMGIWKD